MASERTARLSASPPLFQSRFLDFFSRIHPVVPALIYIPVIAVLVVLGANAGQGALEIIGLFLAGLLIWSLSEYWLHRKVFHWDPDHPIGHRLHFIIHGVHHDHPNDKMRLVMPPGASIPLALLFFGVFWLIFGAPTADPLFESRFLDFFSRIHPVVPALIYVPVIVALIALGADGGKGALALLG
ncbi:MAG: sterol desaturase family protein, partial [Solirubrobacterales bacterium]